MESFWDTSVHQVKFESETAAPRFRYCSEAGLNFSTAPFMEDDPEFAAQGRRGKVSRQDPLSHRIIEKRRRDRMNSCLADLAKLIPQQYARKGRGRMEKTEIIEMAIRHLKHLQLQEGNPHDMSWSEQYRLGYQECLTETARYLLGGAGPATEPLYLQLVTHLRDHCDELLKGDCSKSRSTDTTSASSGSPTNYQGNVENNGFNLSHSPPTTCPDQPKQRRPLPPAPSHLREMLTSCSDLSSDDVKDLTTMPKPIIQTNPITIEINNKFKGVYMGQEPSQIDDYDIRCQNRMGCFTTSNIVAKQYESVLRNVRKSVEAAKADLENNNNNYKFKNYIKQRFSQSQDFSNSGNICINVDKNSKRQKIVIDDDNSSETLYHDNINHNINGDTQHIKKREIKPTNNGLKPIRNNVNVPIFALHANGTFYVPLSIQYEALRPFLRNSDLLEICPVQHGTTHPVTISVAFNPDFEKSVSAPLRPKVETGNGW